jgi:quercetin dioxygenase-like cupin family protein
LHRWNTECQEQVVFSIPPGWDVDWHAVPARQFMSILKGKYKVSVSDGETRLFGAGELVPVEDLTGKGQYTKNISSSEATLCW